MAIDDYADLPEWVRPGATGWIISWADTSTMRGVHKASVTKILKRDIVVTYAVRGNPIEARIPRDSKTLTRSGSAGRGGCTLYPPGHPEVTDLRATNTVRSVPRLVEQVADQYGESGSKRERKPLRTADDAAAMLDEMQAVLNRARAAVNDLRYPAPTSPRNHHEEH